jgi:hypothetical protein
LFPQLSNLFIFPDCFGRRYLHDMALCQHTRHMRRWGPIMSRDYLLPFLILPSLSLTLLSLYLLVPIQNDGALGLSSNDDELVRWRKTSETTAGSCDGACRAIRHDGLVWQSGSCGGARGEIKKEGSHMTRGTHHHMYFACGTHHHICENHPLKQPRDLK